VEAALLRLAVYYRVPTLLLAVAATVVGEQPDALAPRLAVVLSLLVSLAAAAVAWRAALWPYLRPFVVVDIIVATACVGLTGGAGSPFVLYLTAPVLVPALRVRRAETLAMCSLTVALYLAAVELASGVEHLGVVFMEAGLIVLVPTLSFLIAELAVQPMAGPSANEVVTMPLHPRDSALLESLAAGLTYKEIAARIDRSTESVKVDGQRLYRHLGVHTRAEALEVARHRRWLS
jgi:DNA-binding CsgD family transcriptional regulator